MGLLSWLRGPRAATPASDAALAQATRPAPTAPEAALVIPPKPVADARGTPLPAYLLSFLRQKESFKAAPYLCPKGVPTIGYGATWYPDTGRRVSLADPPVTIERAEAMLRGHAEHFAAIVDRAVKVPLTVGQRAALTSFVFNIGEGGPEKDGFVRLKRGGPSTMLRKLNEGDYPGAAAEFPKWIGDGSLRGLIIRRQWERDVFEGRGP